ncbi:transmembrane protein 150C isoform X1 [Polypterus senegalus]|uniref:transmembrane protein 150C isoform X1 n=2 Tax=Polypterus senegalus TaxID=55291 RepID=UPI001963FD93|nr:transmembrane protein 150C isoform X1 [Polypterus senegalus]XP_039614733.1 transmembrane protein 150C isoform X1 [Polypterus senegalus]
MKKFSIWMFLPLAFSVFTVAGLWIIYVIAIENNKIIPLNSKYMISESKYPPFISLAGNNPPASCVFSQVMNVSAFAAFVIGVFRYVQVKPKIIKPWINISSLTAFSLFCIGVSLIGNFQLDGDEEVHNFGTGMAFGFGTYLCWIQTLITFQINLRSEGRILGFTRLTLSAAITFLMVIYYIFLNLNAIMHAARIQWSMVMLLITFLGTFAWDFRYHRFELLCTDTQEAMLCSPLPVEMSEQQV